MEEKLILDNRYTEHSIVSLLLEWDQLNQLCMRIRHNLKQQIQARNQCRVTEDVIKEFSMMFRHFDKDKTGKLDHNAFKSCLRALGYDVPMVEEGEPEPEFEKILDDVDPNRDGFVYFEDFMPFIISNLNNFNDKTKSFKVGERVLAKWSEDGIWYNAEILSKSNDGFNVLFYDYGNEELVENIIKTVSDIPSSETIDEFVDLTTVTDSKAKKVEEPQKKLETSINFSSFKVGDFCIARWEEDKIWYNAKVLEISKNNVNVCFLDYGNEDFVTSIVKTVAELPSNCDVDVNIGNDDKKTAEQSVSLENSRSSSGVGDSILSVQTNLLALETNKDGSSTLAAKKKT